MLGEFRIKKIKEEESISSIKDLSDPDIIAIAKNKRSTQVALAPMISLDRIPKTSSINSLFGSSSNIKANRKSNFFDPIVNGKLEKEKKKTFYDIITSFYLTKKFISILESLSVFSRPKHMSEAQFNLIGDSSFFYPIYQEDLEKSGLKKNLNSRTKSIGNSIIRLMTIQKNTMKKTLTKIKCLQIHIPTFHPFSIYILFWDLLNLFLFSYLFVKIPINLSFGITIFDHNTEANMLIIKSFIIGFYISDIMISCNLGHYKKGSLILERAKIVAKYVHHLFWFDLLSLVVIIYEFMEVGSSSEKSSQLLFFIYFLKFFKVRKIVRKIEELLVVDQNYFNIFSLFLLLLRLIVVAHIAACIWHFLAFRVQPDDNTVTWLSAKGLVNEDWDTRYLYSFYFIVITMNTVGYGDITPQNPVEVLFCVFFVFVACIMFGYCINCVGTIFQDFYKRESEFKKDLFCINDFMKAQNIPKELQIRIRKYLEHLWKEEKIHNIEMAKTVLNKLSDSLKFELLLEVNAPIIKKIDLLCLNFSEKTLREVIKLMKEERYTPGDIIFNKGDYENKDLFLIKKGCIQIFFENELKEDGEVRVLKELTEGQLFGEIAFFSDQERTASAKSKEFTTLIRIDQSKFKNLIDQNNLDREKFNQIKDSIRLYNNYDGIHLSCYSCNHRGHLIFECPKLHRIFFRDVCIRKHTYSTNQERGKFFRIKKKSKRHSIIDPRKDYYTRQFFNDVQNLNDGGSEIEDFNENDESGKDSPPSHEEIGTFDCMSPSLLKENNMEKSPQLKFNMSDSMQSINTFGKNKTRETTNLKKKTTILFSDEEKNKTELIQKSSEKFSLFPTTPKLDVTEKITTEFFLNFDVSKSFLKYFPLNNVANVVNDANKTIYNFLKKKKKAHLFDRSFGVNNAMELLSEKSPYHRQTTKLIKDSPKRNILKKNSAIIETWKQALANVQLKKQKKEETDRKFKWLKGKLRNICNLFMKK